MANSPLERSHIARSYVTASVSFATGATQSSRIDISTWAIGAARMALYTGSHTIGIRSAVTYGGTYEVFYDGRTASTFVCGTTAGWYYLPPPWMTLRFVKLHRSATFPVTGTKTVNLVLKG